MTPAPSRLIDDRINTRSRCGELNTDAPIDALWFEPGTAADAAAAINLHRPQGLTVSANWVRSRWRLAQKRGRLPPFERPANGFPPGPLQIVKRFVMLSSARRAA